MLVWCSRAAALASRSNRRTCLRVQQRAGREHLQGHAAAQRLLLGLVDDPHAAPADLAEDAVVAQPLQPGPRGDAVSAASEPVVAPELSPRSSIISRAGNRSRISSASSGWRSRYSLEGRLLAAALAVEELLGQELDGVALVAGGVHRRRSSQPQGGCTRSMRALGQSVGSQPCLEDRARPAPQSCSLRPGIDDRISLSRFRARM